ncbi:MAG: flagellar biosynthesis protein FlgI [Aquificae bacterium]|nr:flagellar biosynthesis protein FlgI [Aquificota bacterium]
MRIGLLTVALCLLSSLTLSQEIESLLKSKGCYSCHDLEKSKVGPPFKVIAKEYKNNPDAMKTLVQSLMSGSVGKWQGLANKYGITITSFYMPRQPVSKEEAEKISKWILSLED